MLRAVTAAAVASHDAPGSPEIGTWSVIGLSPWREYHRPTPQHGAIHGHPRLPVRRPGEVHPPLPGRRPARPPRAHACRGSAHGPRHAARRSPARRHRAGRLRPRLLLGRREDLLADAGRDLDRRRLRGRLHAEPDLPGGLLGPDRPRRGGPGRLRPGRRLVRASCSAPSGSTTTPRRGCARATTRGRSTARPSMSSRGPAGGGRGVARRLPGRPREGRLRDHHDRDRRRPGRSTTPRTTTSSTSTRTRTATARTTGRAWPARSGSGVAAE